MNTETPLLDIWRFTDGKPGHENQSLGLIQALQKRRNVRIQEWRVPSSFFGRWRWFVKWKQEVTGIQTPDLIIGAGHRTHRMVLRARKFFGGRSIILMKPSLPVSWFDLCIIPEHDHVKSYQNVMKVLGVLNTIEPSNHHDIAIGLMLIGGPCRHVCWSDEEVVDQIATIVTATPEIRWELTTSRRTPPSFLPEIQAKISAPNLTCTPVTQTKTGWVAQKLEISKYVWATSDSVSMLYEALTSGASTGVLDVPWTSSGKLRKGVDLLIQNKMVTPFSEWSPGVTLAGPSKPLHEAQRVADWMIEEWFKSNA